MKKLLKLVTLFACISTSSHANLIDDESCFGTMGGYFRYSWNTVLAHTEERSFNSTPYTLTLQKQGYQYDRKDGSIFFYEAAEVRLKVPDIEEAIPLGTIPKVTYSFYDCNSPDGKMPLHKKLESIAEDRIEDANYLFRKHLRSINTMTHEMDIMHQDLMTFSCFVIEQLMAEMHEDLAN